MKKMNSTIIFLLFTVLSFGQIDIGTEKQALENLIAASFDEVFSDLNAKKMDKLYTEDFLLLEDGIVQNKDSISDHFDKTIKATIHEKIIPKRINTFEFIDIKISSGMAWIAYQNHAVWLHEKTVYGKMDWLESAAAIKTKEGWKLQMLHSTAIENK